MNLSIAKKRENRSMDSRRRSKARERHNREARGREMGKGEKREKHMPSERNRLWHSIKLKTLSPHPARHHTTLLKKHKDYTSWPKTFFYFRGLLVFTGNLTGSQMRAQSNAAARAKALLLTSCTG